MYKSKRNSILKKILKVMSCTMTIFFLFISASFAWEASVAPLNFLNKRVNSAKKNLEINSAEWKAVVRDLYSNSLKQVELTRVNPMLESVKTTTVALNNNYLCNMKDNDTINILYKSNDDFRKQLRNLSNTFKKPTKNDMVNSCEVLMKCILSTGGDKKIIDSLSYCKLIVNDYYTDEYKNSHNLWSLTESNKWSDAFRNKSLSDSSYDILNDIYILARILFDTPEEPAEVLFYDMPNIWPADNWVDPFISMVNDRFSPYYQEDDTWSPNNWNNSGWNNGWNGSSWAQNTTIIEPEEIAVEWELGYDIIEFTQTVTQEVEWKEWYEFLWNDCIDEFTIEWYDGYSYDETTTWVTMTPTEYRTTIINQINTMACENDDECNQTNPNTLNNPDNPNTPNNPTNPDNPINPEDLFDLETLSCFQSCNSVPCNATSCDRLVCYAKCLCISYESPFFDPAEYPWLWPIFKLKFCIQPVQDHTSVASKKATTLESVVNAINEVMQDLRNSWELMLNKKTKEYLDAWLQNNKVSQISLSIDWFEKVPTAKQSEKQEKQNQINTNTSFMENILWFEKEETVNGNGRNKYIIKWSSTEEWVISSTETKNIPDTSEIINDTDDIIWSLKYSHLDNMWWKVYEFLQWNLEFWQSFKDAMDSMNNTANSLAEKK